MSDERQADGKGARSNPQGSQARTGAAARAAPPRRALPVSDERQADGKGARSNPQGSQARTGAAARAAPPRRALPVSDEKLVGSPGFEPGTYRLKVRCSTD